MSYPPCQPFLSFVRDNGIYPIFLFMLVLFILTTFFFNHQNAYGPTFKDIWWLGHTSDSDESDSSGVVNIYYTYPKKVVAGRPFEIGVTLENRKDERVVANWLAFTNVSVSLRNISAIDDVKTTSIDSSSGVIRPSAKYTHSFLIDAPKESGIYLPFIRWISWFGPGSAVLEYFDYKTESYYNKKERKFGIITKEELPHILVVDRLPKEAELGIEIDDPYGKIKPIDLNISNTKHNITKNLEISNGKKSVSLPINNTYTVEIDKNIEMVKGEIEAEFVSWSDGNTSNPRNIYLDQGKELFAIYKTKYKLVVASDYHFFLISTDGEGWYDSGSQANYAINRWSLIKSFDHWEGDVPDEVDDIPAGHLVMDGPKEITAKWKDDGTVLSAIAAFIGTAYTASLVVIKKEIARKIMNRVKNIRKKPKIKDTPKK